MEIILQACHFLHPPLETLNRSPKCSGGPESYAGRATSSICAHGPLLFPCLRCISRHNPSDPQQSIPHTLHCCHPCSCPVALPPALFMHQCHCLVFLHIPEPLAALHPAEFNTRSLSRTVTVAMPHFPPHCPASLIAL